MSINSTNDIDISDITRDENGKTILDNISKIVRWIKFKHEEQKADYNNRKDFELPFEPSIDLSKCVINTTCHDGKPSLTILSDIIDSYNSDEITSCFTINKRTDKYAYEINERLICNDSIIHGANFGYTKYNETVSFVKSEFKVTTTFNSCYFNQRVNFNEAIFNQSFIFDDCTFNDTTLFDQAHFYVCNINFYRSIFKDRFSARNIILNDISNSKYDPSYYYFNFRETNFHRELDLSGNKFTYVCDFEYAKFYGTVNFKKTSFETDANFNNTEVIGHILIQSNPEGTNDSLSDEIKINNISFDYAKISGRIDIENSIINELTGNFATINSESIFRIYESHIESIDLTSIYNKGIIIFEDNHEYIKKISLTSATNTGIVEIANTNIQALSDRKTACILKNSALKVGNNIDAMEYYKKEMELFKSEPNKNQHFETSILLWLNGVSNDHGTKWTKGVLFTLICWFGFYTLFILSSRSSDIHAYLFDDKAISWNFSTIIFDAIKYLWPLNFLDLSTSIKLTSPIGLVQIPQLICSITFYIIGKIAIGYGIYQTISAFRKYKNQ